MKSHSGKTKKVMKSMATATTMKEMKKHSKKKLMKVNTMKRRVQKKKKERNKRLDQCHRTQQEVLQEVREEYIDLKERNKTYLQRGEDGKLPDCSSGRNTLFFIVFSWVNKTTETQVIRRERLRPVYVQSFKEYKEEAMKSRGWRLRNGKYIWSWRWMR